MSTKDKLTERFRSLPSDFTYDELIRLFSQLGFRCDNKGATSGSRVRFSKGRYKYTLHRPHPDNVVRKGVLKDIAMFLKLMD